MPDIDTAVIMQARWAILFPDRIKINPAKRKAAAKAFNAAFRCGKYSTNGMRLHHGAGFDDDAEKHENRGNREYCKKNFIFCS